MFAGRIAKNCEGSETATDLQADKFDHHSFMDIRRRHGVPESETKNFITHSNSSSQSINIFCSMFLNPSSHRTTYREPGDICALGGYVMGEES